MICPIEQSQLGLTSTPKKRERAYSIPEQEQRCLCMVSQTFARRRQRYHRTYPGNRCKNSAEKAETSENVRGKGKAVEAEVQRLQDAKVVREVKYPIWLANTVPVKKKNGKWRMCVDFTDLNKACKKDDFPLKRVDKIVDDAANSEMLSLLDMFSGYHQIRVRREDEEKTSFITPFGTFCFVRMPEGQKNAGCTFSRMIAIVLHPQLRRNILAYVDNIVVKSVPRRDHISDLAETFANLKAANLRLNLEKCVFDIHKGKVL
jgi:hypothetical protein